MTDKIWFVLTVFLLLCDRINCQTEAQCSAPPAPCYGRVAGIWPASVGHVASFICDPGFQLSGSTTRECEASGDWSGSNPTCERLTCPSPGEPVHGFRDEDWNTFHYMDVVTFGCESGYRLRGHSQLICLASQTWFGILPICEEDVCTDPGIPEFGARMGDDFSVQSSLTFTCDSGLHLVGSAEITCQPSGEWSDLLPRCQLDLDDLSISARIAPRNGGLVCFKDRAQNSLHCGVRCNDGYEHPSSLHDYESIGPATAYEWSFQRTAAEPTMRYPSCVEAFFPGVILEAATMYFPTSCGNLDDEATAVAKENLGTLLSNTGACFNESCDIADIFISCGPVV